MSQPKERAYEVEAVTKADFDQDPQAYMRQSGPDRRIIVRDEAGNIHFAFGGDIAGTYCDDDSE
jgi:hypothetical protein